jgi:uncharacterized membrane protein
MSLIQKLLSYIGITLGASTVDSATKLFDKALTQLKKVEATQEAQAVKHAALVVSSQASHDAAILEAALARKVAEGIAALVNPKIEPIGVHLVPNDSPVVPAGAVPAAA